MSLSAFSIRRPVTTAMFFSGVSLLGLISLDRLQVELMPEVVYPEIFVAVSQQGMVPEQIERELVMPIEEEISQLAGVVEMTSTASLNRGNVRISYEPGTDMKFALLQVQSRMDRLQPSFPARTQISVQRFDANDLSATVMELQVLAAGADLNWLRDYTEEHIAPELAAVEGVVSAQVLGGQQSAVEIVAEPERLQAYRLTMSNLRNALADANQPRVYLGAVYDGSQVFPVSFQGQFKDLRQIDETLIDASIPLRLGDGAEVGYGLQQRTDLSRVNGQSAVGILIQKEDEANLIAVADAVATAIAQLNRDFAPEGVSLIVTNNQAALMEDSLDTLKQAALVGLVLGLAVLFLFLRNARFVAILLLAIPASLLATFNLMYASDLTLNVLSLCGLALAMGMLTDNSIVVMESIFKHFERGKSPVEAARDGTGLFAGSLYPERLPGHSARVGAGDHLPAAGLAAGGPVAGTRVGGADARASGIGTFGHGKANGEVHAVPQGQFAPSGRSGLRRVPGAAGDVGGRVLFPAATGSHRRGDSVFGVRESLRRRDPRCDRRGDATD